MKAFLSAQFTSKNFSWFRNARVDDTILWLVSLSGVNENQVPVEIIQLSKRRRIYPKTIYMERAKLFDFFGEHIRCKRRQPWWGTVFSYKQHRVIQLGGDAATRTGGKG